MGILYMSKMFDGTRWANGIHCNGCDKKIEKWEKDKHRNTCFKDVPVRTKNSTCRVCGKSSGYTCCEY